MAIPRTESALSSFKVGRLAAGELQIWDIEEGAKIASTSKAHEGMINSICDCQDTEVTPYSEATPVVG